MRGYPLPVGCHVAVGTLAVGGAVRTAVGAGVACALRVFSHGQNWRELSEAVALSSSGSGLLLLPQKLSLKNAHYPTRWGTRLRLHAPTSSADWVRD